MKRFTLDGVTYVVNVVPTADQIRLGGDVVRLWIRELAQVKNPLIAMIVKSIGMIAQVAYNHLSRDMAGDEKAYLSGLFPDPIDRLCAVIAYDFAARDGDLGIPLVSEALDDGTRQITIGESITADQISGR